MKPAKLLVAVGLLGVVLTMASSAVCANQDQQSQRKASPTLAEQNAFQAAHTEKDAQTRIGLLDDFTAHYPNSTILSDVYVDYYLAYFLPGNSSQSVEYIDKFIALGDKIEWLCYQRRSVLRPRLRVVESLPCVRNASGLRQRAPDDPSYRPRTKRGKSRATTTVCGRNKTAGRPELQAVSAREMQSTTREAAKKEAIEVGA